MTNPKHREYAKEVGAVAIDVMHDYGGEAQFGNRLLRQMLGATPHYQVGKLGLKSFSPFKKSLEDDGIRTTAWTPVLRSRAYEPDSFCTDGEKLCCTADADNVETPETCCRRRNNV